MNTPFHSRGVSLSGFMFLLIVVCGVAFFGMKVIPMYIEYNSVKESMDALAEEGYSSAGDARKSLIKRMEINYVDSVKKEDVSIKSVNGGAFEVGVDYYVDRPLFYNLTITGHFEYSVTTK